MFGLSNSYFFQGARPQTAASKFQIGNNDIIYIDGEFILHELYHLTNFIDTYSCLNMSDI